MVKTLRVSSQESQVKSRHLEKKYIFILCSLFSVLCLLCSVIGCDAFVRKFTRKKKKKEIPTGEIVLAPQEYTEFNMTSEEQYRRYFGFWKAWQTELTESLQQGRSQKKKIDCAQEALKNLISIKELLDEEMQESLDDYIVKIKELNEQIAKDLYGNNDAVHARISESIKRAILREFSFQKIQEHLI